MTISGSDPSTQIPGLSTQILDYETLFARLQKGHSLVTGNSRLSRVLTAQYNQWRIDRGDNQWQSPAIIFWNLWLDQLWETAALQSVAGTDRAVPGSRQLISLWESALRDSPSAQQLLQPESLVNQLIDTRRLIVEWQLDSKDPAWFGDENENCTAFRRWNSVFEQRCEKDRWISPEDRLAVLVTAVKKPLVLPLGNVDLLGFDEFSPAQGSLLLALIDRGIPVCNLALTPRREDAAILKARDSRDELRQAAHWIRYWYENDPGSSIALVVPDLQTRRREVERQMEEILTPGNDMDPRHSRPWNISMGTRLARLPMIETAFDLLKLLDKRIDIQAAGRVLRSPWLRGASSERNSRALLEKCLRDKYPRQLKLREIRYRAGEIKTHDRQGNELPEDQHGPQAWNSPALCAVLDTLIRFEREHRGSQYASAWAESFDQLLASLGWPLADETGVETSTAEHSHNWQALQSWRDALRELASLDATIPGFGRGTAISQLRQICLEKIFQPHTPPAPIQILGLYEISGLRFDHLWVLGLHNDNWPASARPNPFIPGKLQKAAQLPSSSPQRELEVARTVTRRLLETAPDCVFSYPGKLDGEDVLPSPLLDVDEIAKIEKLDAWEQKNWRTIVAGAEKPQQVPLVMPGKLEHGTARGGSSILKHQALCPFRAYAGNRLGADGLETPADGISPMLHGSLVHSVLEHFWTETRTQANLLQLDEEALGKRVRKHVDFVTGEDRGLSQRPAFHGVEADRVYRHVMSYLDLEKDRDAFEVVGFEQEILPDIKGLPIRLIIDRVDRLASGDEIIIDYKTGKVAPAKWFGDRPEDPQLPLYAISAEKTPAAVVFGIIRDDGCEFKGVVQQEGLLPGLPPKARKDNQYLVDAGYEMPATIEKWRQVLHHLVADFLAGYAHIDPKEGRKTCNGSYCELQSLCRIGELEQLQKTRPETHQEASA